jgi:phospholipid/cholesterol/gamma-HCH transport system ATP-binding protein
MVSDVVLECRDLACGYDEPVLEHVDLSVTRGELVAILGRSGCGKSTLMRTLVGLQRPLSGEVRLFGDALYELEPTERRALVRRLGVLFQEDALFSSMTVEDNVALPLSEVGGLRAPLMREIVRMKLALVGLDGFQHRLPAQLSGGQRRRTAIARAAILDPELLACDEPTAGLDPIAAAEIERVLVRYRQLLGTTIIVVSHELESVRAIASRAVMIDGGMIRASGTVDELARSRDQLVFDFFHARST